METSASSSTLSTPLSSLPPPITTSITNVLPTTIDKRFKRRTFIQEISCHATMIIAGWGDASAGPLIPYIQIYYGISYTVVSMLFVGQAIGFLTAAFSVSYLSERYGLGKVIALGGFLQACGYIVLIPGLPFPVMPCVYAITGFGMALQDACANVFISTLPNAEYKFGLLHASYGLGALVCPLAATAFTSSGIKFSYFYSLSVGLATLNVVILVYAFKLNYRVDHGEDSEKNFVVEGVEGTEMKEGLILPGDLSEGRIDSKNEEEDLTPPSPTGIGCMRKEEIKAMESLLIQTLKNKTMWICSLFIFVYVGAEVSMGGWVVTFMRDNRGGGEDAGYIVTGYWGGITLGRAILPALNIWVGEKRIVPYYIAAGIVLELIVFFIRNLISNAVLVAILGFTMGPLYPITVSLATRILPRKLHSSGLGFIASFGQTGSAVFPFITGALAQKYSPIVLQPVMITLFGLMMCIWIFVPAVPEKKKE